MIAIVVDDVLQATNDEALQMEWLTNMLEFFTVSDDGDLRPRRQLCQGQEW